MEEYKLSVASSPHASSPVGTKNLMQDVLIAPDPRSGDGHLCVWTARDHHFGVGHFLKIFEWGILQADAQAQPLQGPVRRHYRRAAGVCMSGDAALLDDHHRRLLLPSWWSQLFGGLGTNFLNPALLAGHS